MSTEIFHQAVLLREVSEALKIRKGEVYIDATLGGGGHTKKILEFGGKVLGIDVDPDAIRYVTGMFEIPLKKVDGRLHGGSGDLMIAKGNFADLVEIAKTFGVW